MMNEPKPENEKDLVKSINETVHSVEEAVHLVQEKIKSIEDTVVAVYEAVQPELAEEKTILSKLTALMDLLKIKQVYYVDDYNTPNFFALVSEIITNYYEEEKKDALDALFSGRINLNVPDVGNILDELYAIWESEGDKFQNDLLKKIGELEKEKFSLLDYERTREIQQYFPVGTLSCISPDEWIETLKKLSENYVENDNFLILFDQDLRKANADKFKNGTTQGQHLIFEVKQSKIKDNAYCALITHLIENTADELSYRNRLIEEENNLTKTDFLALSKERIKFPELLCDGIKKTLLNGYFEIIKQRSINIIEIAKANTSSKFENLDTYDFDHTILRSSYEEGVWEISTLFRITDNIYQQEIRNLMIENKYAKDINPHLKLSKKISDINFHINADIDPYKKKYELRHQDMYDSGKQINELHLPIENGDIFEIKEGTGVGHYILIGQEV